MPIFFQSGPKFVLSALSFFFRWPLKFIWKPWSNWVCRRLADFWHVGWSFPVLPFLCWDGPQAHLQTISPGISWRPSSRAIRVPHCSKATNSYYRFSRTLLSFWRIYSWAPYLVESLSVLKHLSMFWFGFHSASRIDTRYPFIRVQRDWIRFPRFFGCWIMIELLVVKRAHNVGCRFVGFLSFWLC